MNIYVETNFVLELAFQQEQFTSCEQLLHLCESGHGQLVIPAYSLAEPHEKISRQAKSRKEIQRALKMPWSTHQSSPTCANVYPRQRVFSTGTPKISTVLILLMN